MKKQAKNIIATIAFLIFQQTSFLQATNLNGLHKSTQKLIAIYNKSKGLKKKLAPY